MLTKPGKISTSAYISYCVEMTKSFFSIIEFIKLNSKNYSLKASSTASKETENHFPEQDDTLLLTA